MSDSRPVALVASVPAAICDHSSTDGPKGAASIMRRCAVSSALVGWTTIRSGAAMANVGRCCCMRGTVGLVRLLMERRARRRSVGDAVELG